MILVTYTSHYRRKRIRKKYFRAEKILVLQTTVLEIPNGYKSTEIRANGLSVMPRWATPRVSGAQPVRPIENN